MLKEIPLLPALQRFPKKASTYQPGRSPVSPILLFIIVTLLASFPAVGQSCVECDPADEFQCTNDGGIWNSVLCKCRNMTPIIISLSPNGYHLTSAANGVDFDLDSNGTPERTAWTRGNSDEVFLVLDRNGNSWIDSGRELFGGATEQPPSSHPNGFLALAVFDKPENGGNGDGQIDERDSIYPSLWIWADRNHNGLSEPEELLTLRAVGIKSISLNYETVRLRDQYGNIFRYRSPIEAYPGFELAPFAYDVLLCIQ